MLRRDLIFLLPTLECTLLLYHPPKKGLNIIKQFVILYQGHTTNKWSLVFIIQLRSDRTGFRNVLDSIIILHERKRM